MMRDLTRPFVGVFAAATLLGCVGFVSQAPIVSRAQGAEREPSGAAAPDTSTPPSTPSGVSTPETGNPPTAPDPMAQRINNYLHERLRIKAAQEPLWASLTQVMQDNATALAPLVREQFQARQGGNSIEMLSAGEKLDAEQLDGLRKFIAAYQALYESMSDEQKKIADFVFRRSQFAEGAGSLTPALPGYPTAPPPSGFATIPAYPAYPPIYSVPSYSPLFSVPFVGVAVGPRFGFHGHLGFQHPDFHALSPPMHVSGGPGHPDFQHPGFQHPDFHALPPSMHVSGGLGRSGAPSFHR
jgi:hypothetical protein